MKKWSLSEAQELFSLPLLELLYKAQTVHRENFDANQIQISTLLSIKTGACAENCSYCPQSGHYNTGIEKKELTDVDLVIEAAKKAKDMGSTRFCMGAAWRSPKNKDLEKICTMIKKIKALGLETCATLGLLNQEQANKLKESGLDFYNHNIDTSPEYYKKIITTRTFDDRVETLNYVRNANIKVCCGGIIGMGEDNLDRIKMLVFLANLSTPPDSVPINKLIRIKGTPLENQKDIDNFDFVRTIALARILMPKSYVRLSAGREQMSEELQFLCFLAGANSMFYGEQLLTAGNVLPEADDNLFARVGLKKLISKEAHIDNSLK